MSPTATFPKVPPQPTRPDQKGGRRLRVLAVAEAANPELTSVALIGWSASRALAAYADVHLATEKRNADAILRTGLDKSQFTAIDNRAATHLAHAISKIFRGGAQLGWTTYTALHALTYPLFEKRVWKHFREALEAGDYDIVHRVTPMSPTNNGFLAKRCAEIGVPFITGPINGGTPWPKPFAHLRRAEREWLSYVRNVHHLSPARRSTLKNSAAIIAASRAVVDQLPKWAREKTFYIPENAIDPERFPEPPKKSTDGPLRVVFAGRLVPYKGADMLLEACLPLIRDGRLTLDILGDGPLLKGLRKRREAEGLSEQQLGLPGWIEHREVAERLGRAHVFGFPSVREFGGGVVLEAMAQGLAPVILDYGGPTELLTDHIGFRVPMGERDDVIAGFRKQMEALADDPSTAIKYGVRGRQFVLKHYTWDAKALQFIRIYHALLNGTDCAAETQPNAAGLSLAGRALVS